MSWQSPPSALDNGLTAFEQAQVEPMAKWALREIRSNDQWLMPFDDLVEALEEEQNLRQAMIDEVLACLTMNHWAVRLELEDGRWYMQGLYHG